MTWALRNVPGVEHVFEFEAAVNRLFTDRRLIGVCAYDRRRFNSGTMERASAAHAITPGSSMLRCARLPGAGLALEGEADIANRKAVAALIECLPDTDATLDLTGLAFADAASLGLLVRFAATRTHRTRVCCTSRMGRLLRLIDVAGVATIEVVDR
jgi:anti-anti-sigma factor